MKFFIVNSRVEYVHSARTRFKRRAFSMVQHIQNVERDNVYRNETIANAIQNNKAIGICVMQILLARE